MAANRSDDPSSCRACRATGTVVSTEGGESHQVPCPWCEGSGRFIAGHDAQAARRAAEPGSTDHRG